MTAAAARTLARLREPAALSKGETAITAAGRPDEKPAARAADRFLDVLEVRVYLSFHNRQCLGEVAGGAFCLGQQIDYLLPDGGGHDGLTGGCGEKAPLRRSQGARLPGAFR